jgi:hypothetical protein
MPQDMISIEEAEREYGIKRSTLYRYVKKGELQTFHRGMDRRAYVRRSDLETLRRFRTNEERGVLTLEAIERTRAIRRREFGDRFVSRSSNDSTDETRQERTRTALDALEQAEEFQRRVFGDRFVSVSSAEVIEQSRRERTEDIG